VTDLALALVCAFVLTLAGFLIGLKVGHAAGVAASERTRVAPSPG